MHTVAEVEPSMFTCLICRFDAELDDVAVRGSGPRCICIRCFARETGTAKWMPKSLRSQLHAALAAI
jgi:ribosomal protein L40E